MYLFVGEERSDLAIKMGVTWEDGRLAAKQLFDALIDNGISPGDHRYTNYFEPGNQGLIRGFNGVVVGMGNKVSAALTIDGVDHIKIIHPAARGKIRLKSAYSDHIRSKLLV